MILDVSSEELELVVFVFALFVESWFPQAVRELSISTKAPLKPALLTNALLVMFFIVWLSTSLPMRLFLLSSLRALFSSHNSLPAEMGLLNSGCTRSLQSLLEAMSLTFR
jgi:hypothetical protein